MKPSVGENIWLCFTDRDDCRSPAMRCRMASASMEGKNAVKSIGGGCKGAMSAASQASRRLADWAVNTAREQAAAPERGSPRQTCRHYRRLGRDARLPVNERQVIGQAHRTSTKPT